MNSRSQPCLAHPNKTLGKSVTPGGGFFPWQHPSLAGLITAQQRGLKSMYRLQTGAIQSVIIHVPSTLDVQGEICLLHHVGLTRTMGLSLQCLCQDTATDAEVLVGACASCLPMEP